MSSSLVSLMPCELMLATVAFAARTRSPGASSISSPRRPPLQNTVPNAIADASTTTGSRLRWPTGEMPPATYPVARSAAVTSAIAPRLPPTAAASALRSSWPSTGTTPATRSPSTDAISVLNTRSADTPSASLASRPYEAARGSCAYSCTVNGIFARSSATVAVVPRPATKGHHTAQENH